MDPLTEPLKVPGSATLHRLAIDIDTICPSPTQPRKNFDPAELADLAASITRHGLLEPILLRTWPSDYAHQPTPRPHYELVAGERRWRAAKIAGLTAIESKVLELTDEQTLEIQLVENLKRKDLTALEEADGYRRMVDEYKYSVDKIAEQIGQSKSYVYARLKLATLCHEGRKAFAAGKLDASKALLIARIPTGALQEQALLEITNTDWQGETMSYRRAAEHVQRKYMLELNKAPFEPNDQDLVPTAGRCKLCPKRSGNAGDLFSDVKNANVCTDPDCYQAKVKAQKEREIKAAREQGIKVIDGKAAEKILPNGAGYCAQGGMVALDEAAMHVDGKAKTYRELLGENIKPTALVEDTRHGGMIEVVEKKQIAEAMKAAGITTGNDLQAAKEKEAEQAAKRENDYRRRLHDQVRGAIRKELEDEQVPALEREELVMIASEFYARLWEEHRKRIAALWLPLHAGPARERMAVFREVMPTWTSAELLILLLDMALIGETHVSSYYTESKPEKLLELARHSAIDAAALKKAVAADGKPKAAKKKPQAPKAAAEAQPETAKPAEAKLQIGNRVAIPEFDGASQLRQTNAGEQGVITGIYVEGGYIVRLDGSNEEIMIETPLPVLPAAPEEAPPPSTAARAAGSKRAKKTEPAAKAEQSPPAARRKAGNAKQTNEKPDQAAPAAAFTGAAWPFPNAQLGSPADRLNQAAPAGEEKRAEATIGKGQDQAPASPPNEKPAGAAPAARPGMDPRAAWPFPKKNAQPCLVNDGKSRKVIDEKPSGEEPPEDATETPARCDRTVDMFEEAGQ